MNDGFMRGFIKAAMSVGLSTGEALDLYKTAGPGTSMSPATPSMGASGAGGMSMPKPPTGGLGGMNMPKPPGGMGGGLGGIGAGLGGGMPSAPQGLGGGAPQGLGGGSGSPDISSLLASLGGGGNSAAPGIGGGEEDSSAMIQQLLESIQGGGEQDPSQFDISSILAGLPGQGPGQQV